MALTSAERMRRLRRRQARGIAVLPIEVDHTVIEDMIAAGMVGEAAALDPAALATAVGRVLREMVRQRRGVR